MIRMYTDGACLGNPGPGGWGIVVERGGARIHTAFGHEPETTNNRMELQAIIEAYHYAEREMPESEATVTIHTDSQYAVNGINDWMQGWIRQGWRKSNGKPVVNQDLWLELEGLRRARELIRVEWVRGHAGNAGNELADQLAKQGAQDTSAVARTGNGTDRKVVIHLEGGLVDNITIPPGLEGWTFEVHDYDTEGADEDRLSLDDKGRECVKSVWP